MKENSSSKKMSPNIFKPNQTQGIVKVKEMKKKTVISAQLNKNSDSFCRCKFCDIFLSIQVYLFSISFV